MSQNLHEILDFAIQAEEDALRWYLDLAATSPNPWMKEALEGFAQEEARHKERLQAFRAGNAILHSSGPVADLKIGDYLVDVEPTPELTYQEALVIAMKKEKAAFRLYMDLAAQADGEARELLLSLAQEEAKHKLRFEIEWDEQVLREN